MAYVAVSGGEEAIAESIRLLDYFRSRSEKHLDIAALGCGLNLLVDRVMSEAGLYAPAYAALALKQCEGYVPEAVFLLRAYRSTLTRDFCTRTTNTDPMRITRRISAAFKDIRGGQILGATYDYTHRLIRFDMERESETARAERIRAALEQQSPLPLSPNVRVSEELKEEGLIDSFPADDSEPFDVTANRLEFPCPRSARLQVPARADAGFISGLAYSSPRGFGQLHPTVGELRVGFVELQIPYLLDDSETLCIGEICMSEVEVFQQAESEKGGDLKLEVGYGAVFGRDENKAIAVSVLDRELSHGGPHPAQDEEFVLTHGDSLEMNGFISHLKLPHYVTFQSKLDAVRKTRKAARK